MSKSRPDLKPYVDKQLTVIAWIWARTVKSPNPAFRDVEVPLASTFVFSTKPGKETFIPVIEGTSYRFKVRLGKPRDLEEAKNGTKLARGANFQCLMSKTPISPSYIKAEGKAGRMHARLMSIVAEGDRGRVYLDPTPEMEAVALGAKPSWKPDTPLPDDMRSHWTPPYGLATYSDIFTSRQLVSLTTFSDLVKKRARRLSATLSCSHVERRQRPRVWRYGCRIYADALMVYLGCVVDRMAYYGSSLSTWLPKDNALRDCMPRQGLVMSWEFAEGNPLGKSSGDVMTCVNSVSNYLDIEPTGSRVSETRCSSVNRGKR